MRTTTTSKLFDFHVYLLAFHWITSIYNNCITPPRINTAMAKFIVCDAKNAPLRCLLLVLLAICLEYVLNLPHNKVSFFRVLERHIVNAYVLIKVHTHRLSLDDA